MIGSAVGLKYQQPFMKPNRGPRLQVPQQSLQHTDQLTGTASVAPLSFHLSLALILFLARSLSFSFSLALLLLLLHSWLAITPHSLNFFLSLSYSYMFFFPSLSISPTSEIHFSKKLSLFLPHAIPPSSILTCSFPLFQLLLLLFSLTSMCPSLFKRRSNTMR